jgi:hypothetical protein
VRVEFAGSILSPNNELNSFTWAGCGKGTVAEHLQAIYGKDDSFEWFGGNMDAKWLVGGLSADDFTDYQLGFTCRWRRKTRPFWRVEVGHHVGYGPAFGKPENGWGGDLAGVYLESFFAASASAAC